MRIQALVFLAATAPLFGAYPYYNAETWGGTISANWTQNGNITAAPSGPLTSPRGDSGSLISNVAVPGGNTAGQSSTTGGHAASPCLDPAFAP